MIDYNDVPLLRQFYIGFSDKDLMFLEAYGRTIHFSQSDKPIDTRAALELGIQNLVTHYKTDIVKGMT